MTWTLHELSANVHVFLLQTEIHAIYFVNKEAKCSLKERFSMELDAAWIRKSKTSALKDSAE